MENLTLTNFAGLNTKSPNMELSINPVESPNIINAIMEEGTIYSRPPQNIHYSSSQLGTGNINTFHVGRLKNQLVSFAQIDNVIKKKINATSAIKDWWNTNWNNCRQRTIKNLTQNDYVNLILEWKLPVGFDYTNIKTNGEDLRFIVHEDGIPKELPYYIKKWDRTGATESIIYVKFSIKALTLVIVNMYYGNPNATEQSTVNLYRYYTDIVPWYQTQYHYFGTMCQIVPTFPPYRFQHSGIHTWGYRCFEFSRLDEMTAINSADRVYLKTKWNMMFTITKGGVLIKLDNILNYKNGVFIGFRYDPPDFYWKGIEFEYENDPDLVYTYNRPYRTFPYEWNTTTDYWIEVEIDKDKKTIYGKITDGTNTIYEKTISNLNIDKINVGMLWIFLGGFHCNFFRVGWDEFFAFYSSDPAKIEVSTLSLELIKGAECDWTVLYSPTTPPIPSKKPYQILTFLNRFIFLAESDEEGKAKEIQTWNGTTTTALPGPKKAKFGLVHKNRLWLFNFPETSTSMFWYSNINKIMDTVDWQTNGVDNIEYVKYDDGFGITGVGTVSDNIVVFKENTAYLIYGDIPNIIIKQLNIDVGCLASRSIAQWENGVFFLSKIGIHFTRGAVAETPIAFTVDNIQTDNLATKILPLFNNLNKEYLKNAIGVVWNDRYFCAVPTYDSIVNNVLLVLDYRLGWWSYWIPPEPITDMFVDPVENVFYIGTTGGNVRLQTTRSFEINEEMLEDNKEIKNRYDTGYMDLGIPNTRKRLREIQVLFSGSVKLELDVDGRFTSSFTLSNGNILTRKKIPVLQKGTFFRINLKNFTNRIHSLNLKYDFMRT